MKENSIISKDQELVKENSSIEIGGFDGIEPTVYGDWQHNGKVTDF